METRLKSNLEQVRERLRALSAEAGRPEVQLLAVTKSVGPAVALALFELGCRDLAENRADDLEAKVQAFRAAGCEARWHFVGHLQRNKARRVVRLAHAIHSVDSPALLEALERLAREEGRCPGIFLQVKLAAEETKGGLAPAELPALVARARTGPLPLLGLMVMAPLLADPFEARCAARAVFERAAALARTLPAEAFEGGRVRLSMGMSQDYEEAVRAGADCVRIGGLLFEGLPTGRGSRAG